MYNLNFKRLHDQGLYGESKTFKCFSCPTNILASNNYKTYTTRHIQNIFKTEELDKNSVCSYFEHTASDGKYIKYNTIL